MLRVAQDLDADFVIFGSFTSDGKSLTIESRVLRNGSVNAASLVRETGPARLFNGNAVQARLAFALRKMTSYRPTLADFSKGQALASGCLRTLHPRRWPMKTSRACVN